MVSAVASKAGPGPPTQAANTTAQRNKDSEGSTPHHRPMTTFMPMATAVERIARMYVRASGDLNRDERADVDILLPAPGPRCPLLVCSTKHVNNCQTWPYFNLLRTERRACLYFFRPITAPGHGIARYLERETAITQQIEHCAIHIPLS